MNALNSYRLQNNLTFEALAAKAGNDKTSVFRHCHGREIPPKDALLYEANLRIPRHHLRPDLWPKGSIAAQGILHQASPCFAPHTGASDAK